jgi:hypothetical protein
MAGRSVALMAGGSAWPLAGSPRPAVPHGRRVRGGLDLAAVHDLQETVEQQQQTRPPGVHDTGGTQGGQLLGRAGERLGGGAAGGFQDVRQAGALVRSSPPLPR